MQRGQQARIAEASGIRPSHLSEILSRKRGVSPEKAKKLESASDLVLGYPIPFEAWVCNKSTRHPAFKGDPVCTSNVQ